MIFNLYINPVTGVTVIYERVNVFKSLKKKLILFLKIRVYLIHFKIMLNCFF